MLSYDEFKERVMKEFLDYMPESYSDCELEIRMVPKTNTVLTGVVIKPIEKKKSFCSPTFYMERMYEQYLDCESFERVMTDQAIYLEESLRHLPKEVMNINFNDLRSKIIFQVVNAEQNEEMLKACPNRELLDLAVVYRAIISCDEHGVSGFLITNDIAQAENLKEEELYQLAMENTKTLFPIKSERIEETMIRMMQRWGASDDEIDRAFSNMDAVPEGERVYVISNEHEFFGANALLYPDAIKDIASRIGTDCYVLPSSVHELVILSKEFTDGAKLASLVRSTNDESVNLSDKLSDSVYEYDAKENVLRVSEGIDIDLDDDLEI